MIGKPNISLLIDMNHQKYQRKPIRQQLWPKLMSVNTDKATNKEQKSIEKVGKN